MQPLFVCLAFEKPPTKTSFSRVLDPLLRLPFLFQCRGVLDNQDLTNRNDPLCLLDRF